MGLGDFPSLETCFCYKSTNQSRIMMRRHHQYSFFFQEEFIKFQHSTSCLRTNSSASSRLRRVFLPRVFSFLPGGQLTALHNLGDSPFRSSRERALRVIRVIPRLIGAKIVHTLAVYREYCWKHLFARESGVRHDAVDVRAKFREETLARDGVALARRW